MAARSWTHACCVACWNKRNPNAVITATKAASLNGDQERCCLCGAGTASGIYVREHPESPKLVCAPEHRLKYRSP